jgi:hypothetical protein
MQSAFTPSLNDKPSTPHRQDRNRTAPGEKEKPRLLTGAMVGLVLSGIIGAIVIGVSNAKS